MEYVGEIIYDELLYDDRRFIIYGFGVQGKRIYDYFKNNGIVSKIVGFCDENTKEKSFDGKKIMKPAEALLFEDVDFLVSGKYEYEMMQYLLRNNVTKIHLISLGKL